MKIILSAILITIVVVVVSQFNTITSVVNVHSHAAIHCDGNGCFEIGSDGTLGESVEMPPAPKRSGQ